MASQLLGIDIGGSVIKAAVFSVSGNLLGQASQRSLVKADAPGFAERDPQVMWTSAVKAVREVLSQPNVDSAEIAAIGVTGFGNGLFLVDEMNRPTRLGFASIDTRAAAIVDEWRREGFEEAVWAQALQPFWSGQPLPIIEWVKRNDADALRSAKRILNAKDMLRSFLTHSAWNERSDLGSDGLFNPALGRPAHELFSLVGLGEISELLPDEAIAHPTDIVGELTSWASGELGLRVGIPVVSGVTDNLAVMIGSGVYNSDQISVVGGTWGINQVLSKTHVLDRSVFQSIPTHLDDWQLIVESTPNSMSNFDWYVNNSVDVPVGLTGSAVYDFCDSQYLAVESQLDGKVLFMPHLYGTPRHPYRSGGLFGLTGDTTDSQMLAAVYEGVAFEHRTLISRLPIASRETHVRLSGGVLRSNVWLQLFADTLNRPIEVPDTDEVGARGIAMVAAVGAGLFSNFEEATKTMTAVSKVVEPSSAKAKKLNERYEVYLKARELTLDMALGLKELVS